MAQPAAACAARRCGQDRQEQGEVARVRWRQESRVPLSGLQALVRQHRHADPHHPPPMLSRVSSPRLLPLCFPCVHERRASAHSTIFLVAPVSLGDLTEVGAPGPYPGVRLLLGEFDCGSSSEFQKLEARLPSTTRSRRREQTQSLACRRRRTAPSRCSPSVRARSYDWLNALYVLLAPARSCRISRSRSSGIRAGASSSRRRPR